MFVTTGFPLASCVCTWVIKGRLSKGYPVLCMSLLEYACIKICIWIMRVHEKIMISIFCYVLPRGFASGYGCPRMPQWMWEGIHCPNWDWLVPWTKSVSAFVIMTKRSKAIPSSVPLGRRRWCGKPHSQLTAPVRPFITSCRSCWTDDC